MTDVLEGRQQNGASETGNQGWVIFETLGVDAGQEACVVSEGGLARDFASRMKRSWSVATNRGDAAKLREAAQKAISAVLKARKPLHDRVWLSQNRTAVSYAAPILSSNGEIFGVQVYIAAAGEAPPPPRTVGTFEWDFATMRSEHTPIVEEKILGIDTTQPNRSLPEIWRFFTAFDKRDAYTVYVGQIGHGQIEPSQPFAAEISLEGDDKVLRCVHMTTRGREIGGRKTIAGLIHDLTDETHPKRDFHREYSKTQAMTIEKSLAEPMGIGYLELITGLFLEWDVTPPGPLARWRTEVAEIHEKSRDAFLHARESLRNGDALSLDVVLFVRFSESEAWTPAELTITGVATASAEHGVTVVQAMVLVRPGTGPLCW